VNDVSGLRQAESWMRHAWIAGVGHAVVRQVLGNLLSNAIKYTPAGGRIHVTVAPAGADGDRQAIAIAVADTGPGIPEDRARRSADAALTGCNGCVVDVPHRRLPTLG
jgi:signal transduction histidine kinase